MSPHRILIVFGTHYGQTAKIARRMADVLLAAGHKVTLADANALPRGLDARDHDAVIVGGGVQFGRHPRSIRRFVRGSRDRLNEIPSAFFSVSGAAAGRTEHGRAGARGYLDAFLARAGWHPRLTASIGGAMAYTQYPPVTRWVLKQISKKAGGPIDTSRDHEFTDWAQVQRFTDAFVALLSQQNRAVVTV